MRIQSKIYISVIAGYLGMAVFYGCGRGKSGSERTVDDDAQHQHGLHGVSKEDPSYGWKLMPEKPRPSAVSMRPITEWKDKQEFEQTKQFFLDFEINGVEFEKLFLSDIIIKQAGRRVPVLFTSAAPADLGKRVNYFDVKHSYASACTIISGYVLLKFVSVHVTALTSNGWQGEGHTDMCHWDDFTSFDNTLRYKFTEYREIAEQLAKDIDETSGPFWDDQFNPPPYKPFLRAIIISKGPILDQKTQRTN